MIYRGFDGINLIEPFLASKRHFIIRQRGDRTVVLENGVRMMLRDLVEHLFAQSGDRLVYKKVCLLDMDRPLYVVAYYRAGCFAYQYGRREFPAGLTDTQ